jgi:hypothetical protein
VGIYKLPPCQALWSFEACQVPPDTYWMGFKWLNQTLEIGFFMWNSSLEACTCIRCTTSCWWIIFGSSLWMQTQKLHCQNSWDLWEYKPISKMVGEKRKTKNLLYKSSVCFFLRWFVGIQSCEHSSDLFWASESFVRTQMDSLHLSFTKSKAL